MPDCVIVERTPSAEEYLFLRRSAGWGYIEERAVKSGFSGSLYSACAVHGDETVGCGRVIGDGGMYFYVQDIIVLPSFQRKGIGGKIMEAIMKYISSKAYTGAFIGLMAASGVSGFYENYGFNIRPADRPGMFKYVD